MESTAASLLKIPETSPPRLKLQKLLGRLFLLPFGMLIVAALKFYFRYSIRDLGHIRQQFRDVVGLNKPLIICPNHLTMIDSLVIMWALASMPYYFWDYKLFAWNIPAIENYKDKPSWRLIAYLGKCIPIDRAGSNEHKDLILATLSYLLRSGEVCMIFPEGTRSRTGRIQPEQVSYGVGRIIQSVPDCHVLCVYSRGLQQETYSIFPKKREEFYIKMELIKPSSENTGRRAARDYAQQIINKLFTMEQAYFAQR